jgi:hypothetical protein
MFSSQSSETTQNPILLSGEVRLIYRQTLNLRFRKRLLLLKRAPQAPARFAERKAVSSVTGRVSSLHVRLTHWEFPSRCLGV